MPLALFVAFTGGLCVGVVLTFAAIAHVLERSEEP